MKIKHLLLFSFLLCIFSCKKDGDDNPLNDENTVPLIMQENTFIISSEPKNDIIKVTDNTVEFELDTQDKTNFVIGNIIVSGVSENAPNGFLRRILSIEETSSKLILTTEHAKLSDALISGEVSYEKAIDDSDFAGKAEGIEVLIELGENSPLSGEISIDPKILFDIKVRDLNLEYLKMGFEFDYELSAILNLAGVVPVELTKELIDKNLKPITVFIGGIFPLVITPEFELEAGLVYSGPQLNLSYTLEGTTEYYVLKESGAWSANKDVTESANLTKPSLELNSEVEIYIKPIYEIEFYDIDAFETELYAKKSVIGKATIEISEGIGCSLGCGISLGAAVELDVLGFEANPSIEVQVLEFPPFYKCDNKELSEDITEVISEDIFNEIIDLNMPLNGGVTPPNIEGKYFVSPFILKSSNIPEDQAGREFIDYTYSFSQQNMENNSIIVSQASSDGLIANGLGSYISGSDKSFTIFTELEINEANGSKAITAEVISGEISTEGIVNFHKTIIMLDNYGDDDTYIENGQGRTCIDSDGLSNRE